MSVLRSTPEKSRNASGNRGDAQGNESINTQKTLPPRETETNEEPDV